MRTLRLTGLLALFLVVSFASTGIGAPWKGWRGSGGWGAGGAYQRMFNPATVENLSGEVVSIDEIKPANGMQTGIHLLLETDNETLALTTSRYWLSDAKLTTSAVTTFRREFQGHFDHRIRLPCLVKRYLSDTAS